VSIPRPSGAPWPGPPMKHVWKDPVDLRAIRCSQLTPYLKEKIRLGEFLLRRIAGQSSIRRTWPASCVQAGCSGCSCLERSPPQVAIYASLRSGSRPTGKRMNATERNTLFRRASKRYYGGHASLGNRVAACIVIEWARRGRHRFNLPSILWSEPLKYLSLADFVQSHPATISLLMEGGGHLLAWDTELGIRARVSEIGSD